MLRVDNDIQSSIAGYRTPGQLVRSDWRDRGAFDSGAAPKRRAASLGRFAKRALDIVVSAFALLLLAPAMLVCALIVAIDGGPVFYAHRRVGRDLKPFHCLKFRTMVPGAERFMSEFLSHHPDEQRTWLACQKLTFDPRTTTIGRVLRRSSIDELPQLLNVLRGEMSLVGPRPVTSDELRRYGDGAIYYASVRPGITGPWQISERPESDYDRRVAFDVAYAQHSTFLGDVAILLRTPGAIVARRGAT